MNQQKMDSTKDSGNGAGKATVIFRVQGMVCAGCSAPLERRLSKLQGVESASVSLVSQKCTVVFYADEILLEKIKDCIELTGFQAEVLTYLPWFTEPQLLDEMSDGTPSTGFSTATSLKDDPHGDKRQTDPRTIDQYSFACAPGASTANETGLRNIQNGCSRPPQNKDMVEKLKGVELKSSTAACNPPHQTLKLLISSASPRSIPTNCRYSLVRPPDSVPQSLIMNILAKLRTIPVAASSLFRVVEDDAPEHCIVAIDPTSNESAAKQYRNIRRRCYICILPGIVAGTLAMCDVNYPLLGLRNEALPGLSYADILVLLCSSFVMFYGGKPIHLAAFRALRSRVYGMDLLVSLSSAITFFYSVVALFATTVVRASSPDGFVMMPLFFETAAVVITAVLIGRTFETRARLAAENMLTRITTVNNHADRYSLETDGARKVSPQKCCTRRPKHCSNKGGELESKSCWLLGLGDVITVPAGVAIPAEGEYLGHETDPNAAALVDESVITGETTPVLKKSGDKLVHGSHPVGKTIRMRVTEVGAQTTIGRVRALVNEAENSARANGSMAAIADQVCAYFIPFVLIAALCTLIFWGAAVIGGFVEPQIHKCGILYSPARSSVITQGKEHMFAHGPAGSGLLLHQLPSSNGQISHVLSHRGLRLLVQYLFVLQFPTAVIAMACPCALGLATPAAITVAVGVAARHGIIVRSARAFRNATMKFAHIVFDKTGTLTEGKLVLTRFSVRPLKNWALHFRSQMQALFNALQDEAGSRTALQNEAETTNLQLLILWVVASLEKGSDHPMATALMQTYKSSSWRAVPLGATSEVKVSVGEGLTGRIRLPDEFDNRNEEWEVAIGHFEYCKNFVARSGDYNTLFSAESTNTEIGVVIQGVLAGTFQFSDRVRESAAECIDLLRKRYEGASVWMCTGDAANPAYQVAEKIGIPSTNVVSRALPDTKADFIGRLQTESKNMSIRESGGYNLKWFRQKLSKKDCCEKQALHQLSKLEPVMAIGDGVNDAAALAKATLGIAMLSQRSPIAMAAADVLLMSPDLRDALVFPQLAEVVQRVIKLNFLWAFGFNALGLPIAAGVLYPRVMLPAAVAGLLMAGSSILVILNSAIHLLLFKPTTFSGKKQMNRKSACSFFLASNSLQNKVESSILVPDFHAEDYHISVMIDDFEKPRACDT